MFSITDTIKIHDCEKTYPIKNITISDTKFKYIPPSDKINYVITCTGENKKI